MKEKEKEEKKIFLPFILCTSRNIIFNYTAVSYITAPNCSPFRRRNSPDNTSFLTSHIIFFPLRIAFAISYVRREITRA